MIDRIEDVNDYSGKELIAIGASLGLELNDKMSKQSMADKINAAIGAGADDSAPDLPVEYWLAGPAPLVPQVKIKVTGVPGEFIRFRNGRYTATTPEEVDFIENRARVRVYRSDLPVHMTCKMCGWKTRSSRAFEEHFTYHPVVKE